MQMWIGIKIDNIVVNPGDVPTMRSGMLRKSHAVDSSMLAQSLRTNELKGIYTPDCRGMSVYQRFLWFLKSRLSRKPKVLSTKCLRISSIKGRRSFSCHDLWPGSSSKNAICC